MSFKKKICLCWIIMVIIMELYIKTQKWAALPSIWTPTKNRKLRDVTNSIILSKLIETKAAIAVQDFL